MIVGLCHRAPHPLVASLKDKRMVLRSVKDRLKEFNVAVPRSRTRTLAARGTERRHHPTAGHADREMGSSRA